MIQSKFVPLSFDIKIWYTTSAWTFNSQISHIMDAQILKKKMTMHKRLPYSFPSVSNPKDRRTYSIEGSFQGGQFGILEVSSNWAWIFLLIAGCCAKWFPIEPTSFYLAEKSIWLMVCVIFSLGNCLMW